MIDGSADEVINNIIFNDAKIEYDFKICQDGLVEIDENGEETGIAPLSGKVSVTLDFNVANITDSYFSQTADETISTFKISLTTDSNSSAFLSYISNLECDYIYSVKQGDTTTSYAGTVISSQKDESASDSYTSIVKIDIKPARSIVTDTVASQLSLFYTITDDGTIKSLYSQLVTLTFHAEAVKNEVNDSEA